VLFPDASKQFFEFVCASDGAVDRSANISWVNGNPAAERGTRTVGREIKTRAESRYRNLISGD